MNISFTQSDLNSALQIVQRAVSAKSILPILSGILFNIDNGHVELCSTDLELSIKYRLAVEIKDDTPVVIPARLVSDIVKNLPDAKVDIYSDAKSGSVKLSCGSASFDINTYPVDDFPRFPELDSEKKITIGGKKFSAAVKQVIKAVSKDETRPVLCGILLTIDKGRLTMVTTDSYRLAVHESSVEGLADDINVIIPARCMDEVARICGDEAIEIGLTKNQIYFSFGNVAIVSRLIEGNFPPYKQLLPDSCDIRVKLNRDRMISALKRVSLLAHNNALVKIKVEEKKIQVSAMTADVGSALEYIDANASGGEMEVAFNAQYLIDGLSSINEEEVFLELNSPLKPGIIRPAVAQDFLYLAMPVRIG
ncbi:MAG: DNA polymerase III subunit beta [Firmicutes bacterium]|nr:DNA polymerase III subunit beta [Bacillota bacterium]